MNYPQPYLLYLIYFHGSRDYFECHEVLEEYWKEVDPKNRASHWVGLIQIAVSLYHYRRNNLPGASRTLDKALKNINNNVSELEQLGLDGAKLQDLLGDLKERLASNKPYVSLNLPITDSSLLNQAQSLCSQKGFTWCSPSDLSNKQLIHRHSLRDRTPVILERKNALRKRKGD
ncbi:DUF309 domain-containing protein [Rossellomorea aquimaris]|uniref:DUF309 domain-containing protein n=1 Tax=Rossellomorea aquimaris TaxID=189382 RepID=UPI0007D0900A|nr:DUF309 domain-containing protein [Rossellomorea aquimaris]